MRIPPRPPPVSRPDLGGPTSGGSGPAMRAEPRPAVTLSAAGEATRAARAELARPAVRPDVVAAIKAELAAGTLGGPADIDATVDALLLELA